MSLYKSSPSGFLAEAAQYGAGRAIERNEERNASQATRAGFLPKGMGGPAESADNALRLLGFELDLANDDRTGLLDKWVFPEGWIVRAAEGGDHRHKVLVDPQGRVRGGMFLKICGYDDAANGYLYGRYQIDKDYSGSYAESRLRSKFVKDRETGEIVFQSEKPKDVKPFEEPDHDLCVAWLDENKPEWKNPAAYWS